MGFARRVVRKSVRKATPRTVRRAMHPVRTAKYAVTPRPVRQLSRAVYTVTNPLGAAENALIGAALNAGRRRRRPASGHGRSTTYYDSGARPSDIRAAEGAASHKELAGLMAVQRARFAPAQRPVLPEPAPVDPQPMYAAEWSQRKKEVRFWRRTQRKQLQAEVLAHARAQAAEQHARAQAAHAHAQQQADAWWAALNAGDAGVVTAALDAAFADNPAPVAILEAGGTEVSLVVWLPSIDVLPDRKPHITPSGRLSSKARTKTELNDAYAELLGAHLLATLRETWTVAPSATRARVAGVVRDSADNDSVVFDIACTRDDERWEDDAIGAKLLGQAAGLRRTGRTREVRGCAAADVAAEVASLLRHG